MRYEDPSFIMSIKSDNKVYDVVVEDLDHKGFVVKMSFSIATIKSRFLRPPLHTERGRFVVYGKFYNGCPTDWRRSFMFEDGRHAESEWFCHVDIMHLYACFMQPIHDRQRIAKNRADIASIL